MIWKAQSAIGTKQHGDEFLGASYVQSFCVWLFFEVGFRGQPWELGNLDEILQWGCWILVAGGHHFPRHVKAGLVLSSGEPRGDLRALEKLGGLERNCRRCPKAKASKKPATGICHLCMAGEEQRVGNNPNHSPWPFEDLQLNPAWVATIGQELPWDTTPTSLCEFQLLNGTRQGHQIFGKF